MTRRGLAVLLAAFVPACTTPREPPLAVAAAGSLARPLRAALDSFRAETGVAFALEVSGSLDLARRVTELGQVPDVIALADEEVFPALLVPEATTWYARFARNRLVVARSPRATLPESLVAESWFRVAVAPGVETGRSDPDVDPAGYRTLLLFQLAEEFYRERGLRERLLSSAPPRNVRAKSAELVALLEAGELDLAYVYESSARAARLPFVTLPAEVDLGSADHAERYAAASVKVLGARRGDTLVVKGAPIFYALSIPRAAGNRAAAARFVRFLFSGRGRAILRQEFLDALPEPVWMGDTASAALGTAP